MKQYFNKETKITTTWIPYKEEECDCDERCPTCGKKLKNHRRGPNRPLRWCIK